MHLSLCLCRYLNEKKTHTLDGEVLDNLNKPTKTRIDSSFVRAWFCLGWGQTKLAELNVWSVKKKMKWCLYEEETYGPLKPPEIPEATMINSCLQVNTTAVSKLRIKNSQLRTAATRSYCTS